MAACCPPDSIGAAPLCSEHAVGYLETTEDETAKPLPCYVTGSSWNKTTRVVLLFTDIFGIDAGLHKVVADRLAAALGKTTTVVIPDFFRCDPIVKEYFKWLLPKSMYDKYIKTPQIVYNCKNRVTDVALDYDLLTILMPWICKKSENPGVEISCLGFCFGGWLATHTLTLSERGLLPVKCAIGLHPSFGVEGIHGRSEHDFARSTGWNQTTPAAASWERFS
jgi:dienelactone hydrolase